MNTQSEESKSAIEHQRIMEEYKIWEKSTPHVYDTLYSHALTWPSLTCIWMSNRDVPYDSDFTT